MLDKFEFVVNRLVAKIQMSQTPVPGFIIGLSGTDSIIAFLLAYDALKRCNMEHRLMGVHYVSDMAKQSWFEKHVMDWLADECPDARLIACTPLGGNHDQQRWADLQARALYRNINDYDDVRVPYLEGENYWVAGTVNATEKYLGKYTLMANAVSIQIIQSIWKSEIIEMCRELGVPEIAIEHSRMPDCLCGRDELAAENIELIDDIIRHRVKVSEHSPELLETLVRYVGELKANDFRTRIPYIV